MLLQVRDYIQRERVVSLQQLTRRFAMDESALHPLLAFWIKKGAIRTLQEQKSCQSTCSKCHISTVVFYESEN